MAAHRLLLAEDVIERLFEVPMHPAVSPADVETIVSAVRNLAKAA